MLVIIHDIDIDAGISILLNIEHPDKRNILHKHKLIYIGNGKVVSFSGCLLPIVIHSDVTNDPKYYYKTKWPFRCLYVD